MSVATMQRLVIVAQRRGGRRLAPGAGLAHVLDLRRPGTGARIPVRRSRLVSLGDGLARALKSFARGRTADAVAAEAGLATGKPRGRGSRAFAGVRWSAPAFSRSPETPDPGYTRYAPDETRTASLFLFPTNRCNLGCVYCYASSGPAGGPPLSEHDAAVAIDRFFDDLAPEVADVFLNSPRWRRADCRARRDAIGVAAVPRACGGARAPRPRGDDHERRVRQTGPLVPVAARDRGPVQLRRPAPGGAAADRRRP